eukprot:6486992-Amphidinium_carterae.2
MPLKYFSTSNCATYILDLHFRVWQEESNSAPLFPLRSSPCSASKRTRARSCCADRPGKPPNIVGGNAGRVCFNTCSSLARAQIRATVGRTPMGRNAKGLSDPFLLSLFGIKV